MKFQTGSGGISGSAGLVFLTGSTRLGIGTATPSHTLTVAGASYLSGGLAYKRTPVTANYTILLSDYYLGVDTTSNSVTLTVPAAATAQIGQTFVVKDEGANTAANPITVARSSGDTIDGDASVQIDTPYGAISLYTNGSNWFIY